MVLIRKTNLFMKWLTELRDQKAIARIQIRIDRLALGNPGDVRPVGSGISEMRIDYGPGYRVYFSQRGSEIVILLCGGDKTTQTSDIEKAKRVNEGVQ
jgi:putative addiction module killer protein